MKAKWLQEMYDVMDRSHKSVVKKEPVVITIKGYTTELALVMTLSKNQFDEFVLALFQEQLKEKK